VGKLVFALRNRAVATLTDTADKSVLDSADPDIAGNIDRPSVWLQRQNIESRVSASSRSGSGDVLSCSDERESDSKKPRIPYRITTTLRLTWISLILPLPRLEKLSMRVSSDWTTSLSLTYVLDFRFCC